MLKYGAEENSVTLDMAMLGTDVVVDYGKCFAGSYHILEGYSAMILRVYVVFERLEANIRTEFSLVKIHNVVDKLLGLIMQSKALVF